MNLALPSISLWTLESGLAIKDGSIALVPEATQDNLSTFEDGTLDGWTAYGAGTAVNDGTVAKNGTKSLKIPYNAAANMVYKQIVGNNNHAVYERWFRIDAVPTGELSLLEFATTATGSVYRMARVVIFPSGGSAALYWQVAAGVYRELGLNNTTLTINLNTWYKLRAEVNLTGGVANNVIVSYVIYDATGTVISGRPGCILYGTTFPPATLYSHIGCAAQGVAGNLWVDDVYMAHGYASTSPVAESPWIAIEASAIGTGTPVIISENVRQLTRLFAASGTIKYQYALNNGAYNGSWLTQAQLNTALAGAAITNRTNSLRIKAQFNSTGAQECDISIAGSLSATVAVTSGVPLEQRIFDAVAARFHTITTANGYLTNIGSHVAEWKASTWNVTADCPGVDLRDERIDDTLAMGQEIHKIRITGRCVTTGSASNDDVRKIKADVTTMIGTDPTWIVDGTALAEDTGLVTARLAQIEQGADTIMGVDVQFEIEYTTGIHNAFS